MVCHLKIRGQLNAEGAKDAQSTQKKFNQFGLFCAFCESFASSAFNKCALPKLRQKAHIAFKKLPQIVHAIAQHGQAVDAAAKRKTNHALGI
jgi:hypothetical protein